MTFDILIVILKIDILRDIVNYDTLLDTLNVIY